MTRFKSGEEILETIQSGVDLYCAERELYVFLYNEAGGICYYHITEEEAAALNTMGEEVEGEWSWSWFLGVGGYICDDPNDEGNIPREGCSNIDFCNEYFRENWMEV